MDGVDALTLIDAAIRAHIAHIFLRRDVSPEAGRFKHFELEAVVRKRPDSNSGIYFSHRIDLL
jgi:hypothetical protein